MISRCRLFFLPAVFVFLSSSLFAQKVLKPDTAVITSSFPDISGHLWYRGFPEDTLHALSLVVKEDNKEVSVILKQEKDPTAFPKKKRVILLVEDHFKNKGVVERAFFSNVIQQGISGAINPGDEFMVCTFDWHRDGKYIFNELTSFTDNINSVNEAVRSIKPRPDLGHTQDGADINQALLEAIKMLAGKNDGTPSAIFLFSDDLDNSVDPVNPLDVKIEAVKNNIAIYGLSYSLYSRYQTITRDQLCLPSYGRFFCSEKNDVGATAKNFNKFLSGVITDARGSYYSYHYTTTSEKNGQQVRLLFELKNSGAAPESISFVLPSKNFKEWVDANLLLTFSCLVASIGMIIVILLLFKRSKKNKRQQEEEIRKAQIEIEHQKSAALLSKQETDRQMQKIREQQAAKERAELANSNAEKQKAETDRLIRLMSMKGSFPSLAYSFQGNSGSVEVNMPAFSIGRDKNNDFFMQHDSVSRKHASILFDEKSGYKIIDHGSTNGTLVNGHRITESQLVSGDCIQIGVIDLIFHL